MTLATLAWSKDEHLIQKGEVLSRIVQQYYPEARLYGKKGKIAEVLKLNPQIKNPDLVLPQQPIKLKMPDSEILERVIIEDKGETNDIFASESELFAPDRRVWKLAFYYGLKQLSLEQTGDLGKGEVGVLFFNSLRTHGEYQINDWSWGLQLESYNFRYRALGQTSTKRLNQLFLYGSYRWFMAGVSLEQLPLFRNTGSEVELYKMTPTFMVLGAKKELTINFIFPFELSLKGWFGYPLAVLTENSDVSLSAPKGYSLNAQAEINYEIMKRPDYSLHASWLSGVAHKKLDQEVEVKESAGDIKTGITEFNTYLGLLMKF